MHGRPTGRNLIPTIAVTLAATAALAASATEAEAGAREISASSYGFADSLVTDTAPERPPSLPPLSGVGALRCSVNCGPAFGSFVVRRSDLLTSTTADVSARKTTDPNGHAIGVGGMVVVERLEPGSSGSLTNWVVVSERTVDQGGSYSWSLLSGPSEAPWQANDLYRFEGSSFAMDLAGGAPPTPEASTWVMMLIGLVAVTFAGYRNSGNGCFSILMRKGALI
jgi:hypothetical protein